MKGKPVAKAIIDLRSFYSFVFKKNFTNLPKHTERVQFNFCNDETHIVNTIKTETLIQSGYWLAVHSHALTRCGYFKRIFGTQYMNSIYQDVTFKMIKPPICITWKIKT